MSGSIPGPNGTTVWPINYGEEDDVSESDLDGLMRRADMARKDARMDAMDWEDNDLLSAARRLLDYFDSPDDHPDCIKDDVLNHLREAVESAAKEGA